MTCARRCSIGLGVFCTLLIVSSHSFSQTEQGIGFPSIVGSQTANFHFAGPNELTIVVSILGAVQRPGRYELSREIDLMNLVSLAGGTTERGSLEDIRINRTVRVEGRLERREIRVNLNKLASVKESDLLLNHGDFIVVGIESGVTVQEVLSYLTTAAVLTTAIITVINQTSN